MKDFYAAGWSTRGLLEVEEIAGEGILWSGKVGLGAPASGIPISTSGGLRCPRLMAGLGMEGDPDRDRSSMLVFEFEFGFAAEEPRQNMLEGELVGVSFLNNQKRGLCAGEFEAEEIGDLIQEGLVEVWVDARGDLRRSFLEEGEVSAGEGVSRAATSARFRTEFC